MIFNEASVNAGLRKAKESKMFGFQKRHNRETKAEKDARREENFRRRFADARRGARFWL